MSHDVNCQGLSAGPRNTLSLILLVGITTPGAAYGNDEKIIDAQPPSPLREVVNEEVEVSGTVIAGIAMSAASSGPAVLDAIRAPAGYASVCLTLRSRDGAYWAKNSFKASRELPKDHRLQISMSGSREKSRLARLAEGDLAIGLHEGSCEGESPVWLVSEARNGQGRLEVLINAGSATDAYMALSRDGKVAQEVACSEFREGLRTAFNYRCQLKDSIEPGDWDLTIRREIFDRELPPVTSKLRIGGAP